ncbi:MAG: amidase [Pseudomonadota bacterium]
MTTRLLAVGFGALFFAACAREAPPDDARDFPVAPAMTAEELQTRLAGGELTSEAAVRAYLARIEKIDRSGPAIRSVISINPNAIEDAKARDAERGAGGARGLLHGVPVLVKDNIETTELPTTAGSLALKDNRTGRDAPIISRLRAEGAIILGKTNLSEWANFRSYDSISGWSGVNGQTRNPHHLAHDPCGSSSGSGAAVAAMLAPLAIGTETNGSIACPAAMNGVVGFKPTVGLLSRTHIVPISASQDTAGPMARSVRDAAMLVSVLAGSDPADPATAEADDRKTDYLARIEDGVAGMRIGVFRWAEGDDPAISAVFNAALNALEAEGAILVEIDDFKPDPVFDGGPLKLLLAEFKDGLNGYLETAAPDVRTRSLADLIAFNDANADVEMPLFDQSIFLDAAKAPGLDDPDYLELKAALKRAAGPDGVDRLLTEHDVEALVMPDRRPAPQLPDPHAAKEADMLQDPEEEKEDRARVGAGWLGAIAGYPLLSVPMGETDGLPLGLLIIGTAWEDERVLRIGRSYERASNAIVEPTFRND